MPEPALPAQFRQEIFQQFIPLLRARESCALVGVGSSGKSNIARHLMRADVRLHYFGPDTPHVFVLYVNCKPLAHHPPHKLYLQALDQLTRAAEELAGTYQALLPEIHVVILRTSQLKHTLAEALRMPEVRTTQSSVIVTGPSRTADIEMTLTIGVHGPGELHVFLIDDSMTV